MAGRAIDSEIKLAVGQLLQRDQQLWLGTASGVLNIVEWQAPGKRHMPIGDWLRGNQAPTQLS